MAEHSAPSPNAAPDVKRRLAPLWDFARDLRRRMKHRPVRTLFIIGFVMVNVVVLGIGLKYLSRPPDPTATTARMLAQSLEALDEERWTAAREIAADLRLRKDVPVSDRWIPPYVLGGAMRHDAESEMQEQERKALYLLAARYFDEARHAGFPAERKVGGLLLLGESLCQCGRLAEAEPHLRAALDAGAGPPHATEACRLLAECYLLSPTPDLAQAAEYNRRYLSADSLKPAERDRALLTQARICSQLGQSAECEQAIEQIRPESPLFGEALLLAARQRIRDGDALLADPGSGEAAERSAAAAAHFAAAKQLVRQALDTNTPNAAFRRQAPYLLGLACRRLGELAAAEREFARTVSSQFDTPEGIAAGIEQAEVLYLLGQDRRALDTYRRTFRKAAEIRSFGAPWLTSEEMRGRVEATLERLRNADRLAEVVELVDAFVGLFPDVRAVVLQARFHRARAEQLAKQAEQASGEKRVELLSQARLQHREAGQAFEQLARLRFASRSYLTDLWDSAESYLNGQDYDRVVRMCERFLQNPDRGTKPAALVRIGEAQLARNQPAEALRWLNECIESFPKDPFVYRARLLAAEANLELGQNERSIELLVDNLENGQLTPASREWLDSLFLLGRTSFQKGVHHEVQSRLRGVASDVPAEWRAGLDELRLARTSFDECVRRLGEALQRSPEAPQAIEAHYLVAQSHLQAAKLPKRELQLSSIEATRVRQRKDMHNELSGAAAEFDALQLRLIARQEQRELTPAEQRILRNCYFARADALFDLEKYDEATQAYELAANRYQHEPESLEAFIQIANCQRKLNRPTDARRTLEQARLILNRIRSDADFLATTRYDRTEWNDLLSWLITL